MPPSGPTDTENFPQLDQSQEIVATPRNPQQELSGLREQIESGRQIAQQVLKMVFDAGGPDILNTAAGFIRQMSPGTATFLEALSNMGFVRMEQLRTLLRQRSITLSETPQDTQRLSAIVQIARNAARTMAEEERPNAVSRLLNETVQGIPEGSSVTMEELLTAAREAAPRLASANPANPQQPTNTPEQQTDAERLQTPIKSLRDALSAVNPTETTEATRTAQQQAVTKAMAALNTAVGGITPAITPERRSTLVSQLSTDLATLLDTKGYILSSTATELTLTEYGVNALTQEHRRRIRELRTALSMAAGTERDAAIKTAVDGLNGNLPADRTQRQTLVTLMNTVYATQLASLQRRFALNGSGAFSLDTVA